MRPVSRINTHIHQAEATVQPSTTVFAHIPRDGVGALEVKWPLHFPHCTIMNIFYEESGQFKLASIVQKNDSTYQVDTQFGKRTKIKTNNVLLEFDGDMAAFMQQAEAYRDDIDTDLLWEVSGEAEFTAEDSAKEYFGGTPSKSQIAGTYLALYAAPAYFYKKAKGVFKAAPEETLKQALAAIERKKQQDAQMAAWAAALQQGELPDEVAADIKTILFAPDKQTLTYKAYNLAAEQSKKNFLQLAEHIGAVKSIPQYLQDGFEFEFFKQGTGFADIPVPEMPSQLPVAANVNAFSIDDLDTTEIDDALSVQHLDNGTVRVGIHIAAPSAVIEANSPMEKVVFQRLSTVYFPGNKITMLPDNWGHAFSLDVGQLRPALSIYFDVDAAWQVSLHSTVLEQVNVDANLRIQDIEPLFNHAQGTDLAADGAETFAHQHDMVYLLQLAIALQQQRGKYDPTRPTQYDYSIDLSEDGQVSIAKRERGSPIDTLVSEMMILANSTWAKMLHEGERAAIYRVQPAGKVRMSTQSEAHIGMGVDHYAWCTSPLRRATDYFNQRQLLSLIEPEHFTPRFDMQSSDVFALMRDFDTTYSAYADFQRKMESYWSLVYIQQQGLRHLKAVVLKEDLVRIDGLPLVSRAVGVPVCMPRSRAWLNVTGIQLPLQTISLNFNKFIHTPEDEVEPA